MTHELDASPLPRRRWLRLSLRGLMVLVLILGGVAGWAAHTIRTQRAAVAVVRGAGNYVRFDYEMEPISTTQGRNVYRKEPAAPAWLRRWLGDELFRSVRQVNLSEKSTPEVLASVAQMDRMERLIVLDPTFKADLPELIGRFHYLREVGVLAPLATDAVLAEVGKITSIHEFTMTMDRPGRAKSPATDAGLARLADLPHLDYLAIHDCPNLTDNGVERLVAGLPALRTITLGHGFPALARTLPTLARQHPDLTGLNLDATGVTDEDLRAVGTLARLEQLSLQVTPITAAGLAHLGALPNLKFLTLNGTKVTDEGLRSLSPLVRLERISFLGVPITDAGLVDLAPLPKLKTLDLRRTKVTDAGLASLARMPSLETLELPERITDAGLVALAALPQLKFLDVAGTKVTPAGIATIRQAIPTLTKVNSQPPRTLASPRTPGTAPNPAPATK